MVREHNQFKRMEFFAATRNAISNRVIPNIETKRQHPTTFRDAVRTYLQVPEIGHVFAIPPPQWNMKRNLSLAVFGKRTPRGMANARLDKAFQEFLAIERQLYLET